MRRIPPLHSPDQFELDVAGTERIGGFMVTGPFLAIVVVHADVPDRETNR
jgi:hypothetical protein